jgi:membrane-bound lytic murein transglycosylase B
VSARLVYPLLALGALLAAVVGIGTITLLLAFSLLRGAEQAVLISPSSPGASVAANPTPSAQARADIPPLYLALYVQAAARFGLDWAILAGIGRVECDHGRDPAPSCTVPGQFNSAGAGGPAQFLLSTWQRYGISASGDGPPDMWRPSDAIFSMANYLRASGAPGDYPQAIYAYNHAWWYVDDVLAWARVYSARYGSGRTPTKRATTRRDLPPPPAHARPHRRQRNIRAPRGS